MMALKPCPFCGTILDADDDDTFRADENVGNKWGSVVCCITGPEVRTGYGPLKDWKGDAIDEWNKRAR